MARKWRLLNLSKKMKNNTIKTIDASGRTLGRVASEVAMSLMGKTKATFERNRYSGVSVKVINASNLSYKIFRNERRIANPEGGRNGREKRIKRINQACDFSNASGQ